MQQIKIVSTTEISAERVLYALAKVLAEKDGAEVVSATVREYASSAV